MSSSSRLSFVVPFVKMHGLGNDFVVIDLRLLPAGFEITADRARFLCDRRFGVGCDQLLGVAGSSGPADFEMRIWNADGSRAEMCGNGIRAVALYWERGLPAARRKPSYSVETLGGTKRVEIRADQVRVDMGPPSVGPGGVIPGVGSFGEVSMGNPHAVFRVADVAAVPLTDWGPRVERDPRFPARTNVEFVERRDEHRIRVRVWERGAGATLACGTGACASAVAAIASGAALSPVAVELPGGELRIEWAGGPSDPVWMEGGATWVFEGEIELA